MCAYAAAQAWGADKIFEELRSELLPSPARHNPKISLMRAARILSHLRLTTSRNFPGSA